MTENKCISFFNENGEKVRSIGTQDPESSTAQMSHVIDPTYIALTDTGNIMMREYYNHNIKLFSPEGTFLKYIGRRGDEGLEFNCPRGIAVHPHSKKIYVTEWGVKRVQILNPDFTFSSKFVSQGSEAGSFRHLYSIAFDTEGNVYATDLDRHQVIVFTPSGEFIREFGKKGDDGDLRQPTGIAIDSSGVVYVSEWGNHCISMYSTDGRFLTSIGTKGNGQGEFDDPTDIAIDKEGKIYVTDKNNDRVQVFSF